MADLTDAASELEQWQRDQALQQARPVNSTETPLRVKGVRLCLDCRDPINPQRIAIAPTAVRCTECQGYHDKGRP